MDLIEIDLPGPLPEAFLALSAAAIPDNPADLVARSPVVADLLRVWLSEPAMVVRRRVGLVPAAGS